MSAPVQDGTTTIHTGANDLHPHDHEEEEIIEADVCMSDMEALAYANPSSLTLFIPIAAMRSRYVDPVHPSPNPH